MEKNILLEKIEMECPICGQIHLIERRKRSSKGIVKDETVEYNEVYFLCTNAIGSDYSEFVPAGVMNENLLEARNAYRLNHDLLTSNDIISIRMSYGLTQNEFSLLLGFGEVTIARFETKLIQTKPYDDLIKSARDDANGLLIKVEACKHLFSATRFNQIKQAVLCEIERRQGTVSTQDITIINLVNGHWKTYQNSISVYMQIAQEVSDQILPVLHGSLTGKDECYLSNHGELISALADAA